MTLLFLPLAGTVASCSEQEDEQTNEYANWQSRNDIYFASLDDSLSKGGAQWKKIKSFTKSYDTAADNTEYIYVRILEQGEGDASPLYTDTVRVSYRGRLIPTVTYPAGRVFDQRYTGTFSWETTGVYDRVASGFVDGFTTALMHMHCGDRWRVFIPYQLGYNTTASSSIPAYSTLIFDMGLVDYWHPGEHRTAY